MGTLLPGRCSTTVNQRSSAGEFTLRRIDPDADLDLVHAWMNDTEVAHYWEMAWPRERIASYLAEQHASADSAAYVGEVDGVPTSYWVLYRADLAPLAQHYTARPFDAGLHILLGPAESRGRGLASELLRAVATWQLEADPRATRVVGEPDVSNVRCIRSLERAGFRHAGELDLPHKRAALMIFDRMVVTKSETG